MPKYKVEWEHDVTITYEAEVEAESEEEAWEKVYEGEYDSEKEIDYQGIEIRKTEVEELIDEDSQD